jgi:hypothetical protein
LEEKKSLGTKSGSSIDGNATQPPAEGKPKGVLGEEELGEVVAALAVRVWHSMA